LLEAPQQCPACHGELRAVRLQCERCGTAVEGSFSLGLRALGPDDQAFARAFLLARGNLRALERSFGLSYAALRGRLDGLVRSLRDDPEDPDGDEVATPPVVDPVDEVLRALEAGELAPDEAARRLREVGGARR